MSTSSYAAAPINTNGSFFYAWARPISLFMAACGWKQSGDTGQVVWPVSIVNLVSVVANGATAVFTYTLLQGAALRVGNSIIIKGCTTATLNTDGPYLITALGAGTFTVATTRTVTETETANAAFGSVNVLVAISNAIGNGSTNTYTYTNTDGTLCPGQVVVITGCTTAGFNGTFTVASISAGTFTTTAGISHASEAETGTGIVQCIPAVISTGASTNATMPPALSTNLYEVWQMGDGNSLPIYLRINYGSGNPVTLPAITVILQAATDGAGNVPGGVGNTGTQNFIIPISSTATTFTTYLSGASNRIQIGFMPENTTTAAYGLLSVERSHDSNGNDTTSNSYATLSIVGFGTGARGQTLQISINAGSSTTTEKGLPIVSQTGLLTGSWVTSTWVSPVFPVVGAVGNPMIGLLVGKQVDWLDLIQFTYMIYGVLHNYIVFDNASTFGPTASFITQDNTTKLAVMMRYE